MPIHVATADHEGEILGWTNSPQAAVKLSVDEYVRLIDLEVLAEGDPVELLEGVVTRKMIKKPRHVVVQETLGELLTKLVPVGWFVSEQNPIATADSMPEPDCNIVRGKRRDFRKRYVTAADLAVVIEVADSSLARDRLAKQRIYAAAKIPVYWIVNLVDNIVEVYTDPATRPKPRYKTRTDYPVGNEIPLVLDRQRVAQVNVEEFLI